MSEMESLERVLVAARIAVLDESIRAFDRHRAELVRLRETLESGVWSREEEKGRAADDDPKSADDPPFRSLIDDAVTGWIGEFEGWPPVADCNELHRRADRLVERIERLVSDMSPDARHARHRKERARLAWLLAQLRDGSSTLYGCVQGEELRALWRLASNGETDGREAGIPADRRPFPEKRGVT